MSTGSVKIIEATTRREKKAFMDLPHELNHRYPQWVPMLRDYESKVVVGGDSPVVRGGPHRFLMAWRNGKCVGRVCVGIDEEMNRFRERQDAHFFFFDCIDDQDVASSLMGEAERWAKQMKMEWIKGPISFTNGDDFRGMLVEGFDRLPPLFLNWNPPFYPALLEGYQPMMTYLAFDYDLTSPITHTHLTYIERVLDHYGKIPVDEIAQLSESEKLEALFRICEIQFGYAIEPVEFSNIPRLADDFARLMNDANAQLEEDIRQFTIEESMEIIQQFKKLINPSLVVFTRFKGERVGIVACMPNFNQIFQKIHGKLWPFGWITFLREKNKVKQARGMVFYMSREHIYKGGSGLMLLKLRQNMQALGYQNVEFATIDEKNKSMMQNIDYLGLKPSRRYVVFGRPLTP